MASQRIQSVAEFSNAAVDTADRLERTGEAETLLIEGQPRAVLLSPAAFNELTRDAMLSHDVAAIRISAAQLDAGQGLTVREVFDGLRAELAAMQAAEASGTTK